MSLKKDALFSPRHFGREGAGEKQGERKKKARLPSKRLRREERASSSSKEKKNDDDENENEKHLLTCAKISRGGPKAQFLVTSTRAQKLCHPTTTVTSDESERCDRFWGMKEKNTAPSTTRTMPMPLVVVRGHWFSRQR